MMNSLFAALRNALLCITGGFVSIKSVSPSLGCFLLQRGGKKKNTQFTQTQCNYHSVPLMSPSPSLPSPASSALAPAVSLHLLENLIRSHQALRFRYNLVFIGKMEN